MHKMIDDRVFVFWGIIQILLWKPLYVYLSVKTLNNKNVKSNIFLGFLFYWWGYEDQSGSI